MSGTFPEHQLEQLEQWKLGNRLRMVVGTDGWAIAMNLLARHREQAVSDLLALTPGDPKVMSLHAAAHALDRRDTIFLADIEAAIRESETVPEALQEVFHPQ